MAALIAHLPGSLATWCFVVHLCRLCISLRRI